MTPLLVVIPGILTSPRAFDAMRAHLSSEVDVRFADTARHDTIEALADAAWASLADVAADTVLVVAGYSMGGYVALRMLETAPRPVHGVGLVCTSARADTPEGAALRARAVRSIERDFALHVASLVPFLLAPAGDVDAALAERVRADMHAVGRDAALRQQRAAASRVERTEVVRRYDGPMQVVTAEGDNVVPPALSRELASLARDAELDIVARGGHLLPFEHPERLAARIDALIARAVRHAHQQESR